MDQQQTPDAARLAREPEDTMPPVARAKWLRQVATLTAPEFPEHRRGYLHAAHHIEQLQQQRDELRAAMLPDSVYSVATILRRHGYVAEAEQVENALANTDTETTR